MICSSNSFFIDQFTDSTLYGPVFDELPAAVPLCPAQPTGVDHVPGTDKVTLHTGDGAVIDQIGGSASWRQNNPGNLIAGDFAVRHGAIGEADGRAVFPDYDTGFLALEALISGPSYSNLTLGSAIAKYAPASENDVPAYQRDVAARTGLSLDTLVSSFGADQIHAVAAAIQVHEGFKTGTVNVETAPQECP